MIAICQITEKLLLISVISIAAAGQDGSVSIYTSTDARIS